MPFTIGENVGPYRIVQQLGQGGMATVFRAYHAALDRYVAIKVLHPAFTQDPNFLARFQREAEVVARLEHPSIVPVYDFAEQDGRPYLVMKFIQGETLKARMGRGPIGVKEGLNSLRPSGLRWRMPTAKVSCIATSSPPMCCLPPMARSIWRTSGWRASRLPGSRPCRRT